MAAVAHAFNRMAADLAARQAQLVDADRARRQLLADVSHELMTPLTAIRGYAETLGLSQFAPASREGQRAVHVIQEEGERIERLVGDLLDLARYDAGGVSLTLERVFVADLFERVFERHAQAAQEKQRDDRRRPARRGPRDRGRPASHRAGAAEPGVERAAPHAGGRRDPPARGPRGRARSC